jgi:hypothetical protein
MKAISDMLNQLVCTFFFLKHFIKQRECHAFLLTHLSLDRFLYITKFLAYTICTNIQEMKSMFFLYIITYIKTTLLCFNHGHCWCLCFRHCRLDMFSICNCSCTVDAWGFILDLFIFLCLFSFTWKLPVPCFEGFSCSRFLALRVKIQHVLSKLMKL